MWQVVDKRQWQPPCPNSMASVSGRRCDPGPELLIPFLRMMGGTGSSNTFSLAPQTCNESPRFTSCKVEESTPMGFHEVDAPMKGTPSLVASDATRIGLNLNISRIIFSTLKKFDGVCIRELPVPEIKQIAGKARSYGSKFPVGKVTCLDAEDLQLLHSSLMSSSPIIEVYGYCNLTVTI